MGMTTALGRKVAIAGVPLAGAVAFAGIHRIEWLLLHKEEIEVEGAQLNFDEAKLEKTMGLLALIYVSAELWTLNKLLANQASRVIIQEAAEKAARGQLTSEGLELAAVKAGAAAGIGKVVGKILIADTIIWGITGAVDLGLNFTDLTEEEQVELFDWMGPFNIVKPIGGLSPLGEFVIAPLLEELFEVIPDEWLSSLWEGAKDLAEWTGLDDWLAETAESYVESIDIEVSWWIIGRLLSGATVEGAAIFAAFNPSYIATVLTVSIGAKIVWSEVFKPAWASIAQLTIGRS